MPPTCSVVVARCAILEPERLVVLWLRSSPCGTAVYGWAMARLESGRWPCCLIIAWEVCQYYTVIGTTTWSGRGGRTGSRVAVGGWRCLSDSVIVCESPEKTSFCREGEKRSSRVRAMRPRFEEEAEEEVEEDK